MRIINPESFEFDGEDFQSLRDICRLAIYFAKDIQLADLTTEQQKRALAMANRIVDMPIYFVAHED